MPLTYTCENCGITKQVTGNNRDKLMDAAQKHSADEHPDSVPMFTYGSTDDQLEPEKNDAPFTLEQIDYLKQMIKDSK